MADTTLSLSAFPFLTPDEFGSACRALAERTRSCTAAQVDGGWSSVRLVTQSPLLDDADLREVSTLTDASRSMQAQAEARAMEDVDEDPEALVRTDLYPTLQIDYDIVFSPIYQVPVLYFVLRWHNHQGPVGLDAVYQYVVPEQYRQQLQSVGVMGGISFGYHPESGAPAFFVHPCNTADAMAHVADGQSVTTGTYLLIWLGLVGQSVNLHIPREIVVSDGASPY
ncbi:autophagy-related protein Atg10 [Penicillium brasilianum]|uniref:Ubiquitin-like-conjugating enzyme ATG10 n=1 Tax=Penicillium brasilianum TaxID=104259 RepID=A0A1S9RKM0_PENBI|nr:autophagy-related protein Atg10 [Penicillium brasilianum]